MVEHFSEVLNREDPANPVDEYMIELDEVEEMEEIDLGGWRVQEVKNALKTRNGKAAGVDKVGLGSQRADIEECASSLTSCITSYGMLRSGQIYGRKDS